MIGGDEERGEFLTACPDARDERAQGAVHQAIALEHCGMPGVLEVRRAVDAGKHDEEKAPAGSRGVDPGRLDGAIERGIRAEVMRCGAKDRATERNAMRTVREAAGDRRTDCDALGHEVEHRGRWCDVAVEQGALNAAVTARRTPLFPPPTGGSGAIQPPDAGNAGATGV